MAELQTIQDLLVHSVKDLYSTENQLRKALPKMARAATAPHSPQDLTPFEETEVHVGRLGQLAELLGTKPGGVTCKAMKGLVEEGAEPWQKMPNRPSRTLR